MDLSSGRGWIVHHHCSVWKTDLDQQNNEPQQKQVILAPYGLAATLTGQTFRSIDSQTQKVLDDWSAFYPLHNKETNGLPPIVEVVSGN